MVSEILVIQINSAKKRRLCVISQIWGALKKGGGGGRGFPAGPVVKTVSLVQGAGVILGWGAEIPHVTRFCLFV